MIGSQTESLNHAFTKTFSVLRQADSAQIRQALSNRSESEISVLAKFECDMRFGPGRKMSLKSDAICLRLWKFVEKTCDGGIASISRNQKSCLDRFVARRDLPAKTLANLDNRISELHLRTACHCIFQKSIIKEFSPDAQFAPANDRQIESYRSTGRRTEIDPAHLGRGQLLYFFADLQSIQNLPC